MVQLNHLFSVLNVLALSALLCAADVGAQPVPGFGGSRGPGQPPHRGGPIFGVLLSPALQLTEEQETQVKAVIDQHEAALQEYLASLHEANSAFLTYLRGGGSTDTASYIAAVAEATQALHVEEAAAFAEAYDLLTADQKEILANLPAPGMWLRNDFSKHLSTADTGTTD